jgi:hypothetical protein
MQLTNNARCDRVGEGYGVGAGVRKGLGMGQMPGSSTHSGNGSGSESMMVTLPKVCYSYLSHTSMDSRDLLRECLDCLPHLSSLHASSQQPDPTYGYGYGDEFGYRSNQFIRELQAVLQVPVEGQRERTNGNINTTSPAPIVKVLKFHCESRVTLELGL